MVKAIIVRKPKQLIENVDLSLLNTTELVALAVRNDIPGANRGTPRTTLIRALEEMSEIGEHPLKDKREKFSAFVKKYWDIVQMQLPSTVCPNCHLCSDVRVGMCYIPNKHEGHIQ